MPGIFAALTMRTGMLRHLTQYSPRQLAIGNGTICQRELLGDLLARTAYNRQHTTIGNAETRYQRLTLRSSLWNVCAPDEEHVSRVPNGKTYAGAKS